MKKLLASLLALLMLLSLCACGGNASVYCLSCDSKNPVGASYCSSCGASLAHVSGNQIGSPSNGGGSSSGGVSSCSICAFDGLSACKGHECISCDGEGYIKCYGCVNGSTAYGPCVVCNGGKIDCTCDDGIRYYDRDDEFTPVDGTEFGGSSGGYNSGYSSGYETETEDCSKCENGYVECSLCDGTGKFGSYTVGGFDGAKGTEVASTCPTCGGRKKVACSYCHGLG